MALKGKFVFKHWVKTGTQEVSFMVPEDIPEEDIPAAQEYSFSATNQGSDRIGTFVLNTVQQDTTGKETNIYIVDVETGAYTSFRVVNNITKNQTALLSGGGTGAAG